MTGPRLRKLLAHVPLLAALVASRPVQQIVQTVRGAKAVRQPLRFMALQLGGARAGTARADAHRLRGSNVTVFLRHRTRDVNIFNEIFGGTGGHLSYEPPPVVAARLDCKRALRIIDLGANIGLFGAYALGRWPGAAIRSFEPDPANVRLLTRVIAANGLQRRWSVAAVAVANRAGEMGFAAGLFADSHLELESDRGASRQAPRAGEQGRPITVRVVDLFEQDHDVELIKIDIEGGEWAILSDPRLASLKAQVLVLEWHARGCPEPDARASAVSLLRGAGYGRIAEIERGADNGLLWAWREARRSSSRRPGQAHDRQAIAAEHAGAMPERRDPALGARA